MDVEEDDLEKLEAMANSIDDESCSSTSSENDDNLSQIDVDFDEDISQAENTKTDNETIVEATQTVCVDIGGINPESLLIGDVEMKDVSQDSTNDVKNDSSICK